MWWVLAKPTGKSMKTIVSGHNTGFFSRMVTILWCCTGRCHIMIVLWWVFPKPTGKLNLTWDQILWWDMPYQYYVEGSCSLSGRSPTAPSLRSNHYIKESGTAQAIDISKPVHADGRDKPHGEKEHGYGTAGRALPQGGPAGAPTMYETANILTVATRHL